MREREWQREKDEVELYGNKDSDVVRFGKGKKKKKLEALTISLY